MAKELWKGNEAIAEVCDSALAVIASLVTPSPRRARFLSTCLCICRSMERCSCRLSLSWPLSTWCTAPPVPACRAMTSSSSPGISLKQEGISYLIGSEIPAVIVNCMRGGPGLGTIQPGQADYYQATRGGGNGDYRTVVLAPCNIQEAVDLTQEAFDIADRTAIRSGGAGDGLIGQMMEPIEWRELPKRNLPPKDWATTGLSMAGTTPTRELPVHRPQRVRRT